MRYESRLALEVPSLDEVVDVVMNTRPLKYKSALENKLPSHPNQNQLQSSTSVIDVLRQLDYSGR